jgi:hypothetical protein
MQIVVAPSLYSYHLGLLYNKYIYKGDISCNGYTRIDQISVQKVYNIL